MFASFLIFLPVAACLFWILMYCLSASRTATFWPMLILLVQSAIFLMTDSYYSDASTPSRALVACSLIAQLTASSILPILWIYTRELRHSKSLKAGDLTWVSVPAMLFTAAGMMVLILGPKATEHFLAVFHADGFRVLREYQGKPEAYYFAIVVVMTRSIVLIQILITVWRLAHLWHRTRFRLPMLRDFLFRDGEISVLLLQSFVITLLLPVILTKALLFRRIVVQQQWISIALAVFLVVLICLLGYIGLFGAAGSVTREQMRDGFRYNYGGRGAGSGAADAAGAPASGAAEEPMPVSPALAGDVLTSVARTWTDDSLMGRFEQLIFTEQLFLRPGLTLVELATRLRSNKTYLSRLVNNIYHMTFPDLLNTLRVDYAQQHLIEHPDVRQHELATACGFPSASSFNSTFKRITGVTPKIWLADYERQLREFAASRD